MSSQTGVQPIGNYAGVKTKAAAIALLQGIIPNPDATPGTGSVAGGGFGQSNTYLDEMSPAAAMQLQVELAQVLALVPDSSGQYVVTAGDVAATFATLVGPPATATAPTLANSTITIRRGGAVQAIPDAGLTIVGNNIHVASNGGYVLTAGDVITYRLQT